MKLPIQQVLSDGSYLSEVEKPGSGKTWILLPLVRDPTVAPHIQVRVIEFTTDTDPTKKYRLITTVLSPADISATELATAYLQRWELETAFRQIECQLLEPGSTLRSKTLYAFSSPGPAGR